MSAGQHDETKREPDDVEARLDAEFDALLEGSTLGSPRAKYLQGLTAELFALRSGTPRRSPLPLVLVPRSTPSPAVGLPNRAQGWRAWQSDEPRVACLSVREPGPTDDDIDLAVLALVSELARPAGTIDQRCLIGGWRVTGRGSRLVEALDELRRRRRSVGSPGLEHSRMEPTPWAWADWDEAELTVRGPRLLRRLVRDQVVGGVSPAVARDILRVVFGATDRPPAMTEACLAVMAKAAMDDGLAESVTAWFPLPDGRSVTHDRRLVATLRPADTRDDRVSEALRTPVDTVAGSSMAALQRLVTRLTRDRSLKDLDTVWFTDLSSVSRSNQNRLFTHTVRTLNGEGRDLGHSVRDVDLACTTLLSSVPTLTTLSGFAAGANMTIGQEWWSGRCVLPLDARWTPAARGGELGSGLDLAAASVLDCDLLLIMMWSVDLAAQSAPFADRPSRRVCRCGYRWPRATLPAAAAQPATEAWHAYPALSAATADEVAQTVSPGLDAAGRLRRWGRQDGEAQLQWDAVPPDAREALMLTAESLGADPHVVMRAAARLAGVPQAAVLTAAREPGSIEPAPSRASIAARLLSGAGCP